MTLEEKCEDCSLNYYPCGGEKKIKELEEKLKIAVEGFHEAIKEGYWHGSRYIAEDALKKMGELK